MLGILYVHSQINCIHLLKIAKVIKLEINGSVICQVNLCRHMYAMHVQCNSPNIFEDLSPLILCIIIVHSYTHIISLAIDESKHNKLFSTVYQ